MAVIIPESTLWHWHDRNCCREDLRWVLRAEMGQVFLTQWQFTSPSSSIHRELLSWWGHLFSFCPWPSNLFWKDPFQLILPNPMHWAWLHCCSLSAEANTASPRGTQLGCAFLCLQGWWGSKSLAVTAWITIPFPMLPPFDTSHFSPLCHLAWGKSLTWAQNQSKTGSKREILH